MKKYVAITAALLTCWLAGFAVFVPYGKYANNGAVITVVMIATILVVLSLMELSGTLPHLRFMWRQARKLK